MFDPFLAKAYTHSEDSGHAVEQNKRKQSMTTSYLDRAEASTMLKVSTRTIDRYVRRYRFKVKKEGRRVLIKKEDLDQIIAEHIGQFVDLSQVNLQGQPTPQNEAGPKELTVKDMKVHEVREAKEAPAKDGRDEVYKTLYNDIRKELGQKQERLEAATYRVGQLESQLKNMVPLLDYNRKDEELRDMEQTMEKRLLEHAHTVSEMEKRLRGERVAKWVYLSLVGTLLVAEPILFLVWAFS